MQVDFMFVNGSGKGGSTNPYVETMDPTLWVVGFSMVLL